MASKKTADSDPVVKTDTARSTSGAHPAPAVKDAADSAYDKQYVENPDKPAKESVAQLEVLPGDNQ